MIRDVLQRGFGDAGVTPRRCDAAPGCPGPGHIVYAGQGMGARKMALPRNSDGPLKRTSQGRPLERRPKGSRPIEGQSLVGSPDFICARKAPGVARNHRRKACCKALGSEKPSISVIWVIDNPHFR